MPLSVKRIDPTCWYTGMKNPRLQLMVCGEGVREAEFHTDYPGVSVESVVRLDSPNYLFLYLNIQNAQPGLVPLRFRLPHSGEQAEVGFPLHKRAMPSSHRRWWTAYSSLLHFQDRVYPASGVYTGLRGSPSPHG